MHCILFDPKLLSHKDKERCDAQSGRIKTVGGHAENFLVQDGFLIKKTNMTEGRFYSHLMTHQGGLNNYVPQCVNVEYGSQSKNLKKQSQTYSKVTLEDLRQGFKKPLIYDIKLGIKTVSSEELRKSGSSLKAIVRKDISLLIADKISSSSRSGYRFVGSSASQDSRLSLGTHPSEMLEQMSSHISRADLAMILLELEQLLSFLRSKEGRRFEFIGASVLIIAESDPLILESKQAQKPKVKLIDFAHSNMVNPLGIMLENGALHTPHRKRLYQKGLTFGLANFADDLRSAMDK